MGFLSVRLLTICLTVTCIFVSAFTCAYISITSGDKAVDKTKETGDASLEDYHTTGQSNIRLRTEDLLNTISGRTSTWFISTTEVKVRMGKRLAKWADSNGVDKLNDWNWLWGQRNFLHGEAMVGMGYADSLGIAVIGGVKSTAILYLEDSLTVTRPTVAGCTDASCWHHLQLYASNGSDYGPTDASGPAWGMRAFWTTANPATAGALSGISEPGDHDFGTPGSLAPNPQQTCLPDPSDLKDGFSYNGWCPLKWDGAKETSYKIGGLPVYKPFRGIPKWSGAYTKSDLLGLSLMTTHANEFGQYQGLSYVPCDARTWSLQLRKMVQEVGMPPRLRVWLDFRSAWMTDTIEAMMPTFNQMLADASPAMKPILEGQLAGIVGAGQMMNSTGKLLATSHGVPADYVLEYDQPRGMDVPQAKLVMSTQLYPTPDADGTVPQLVRDMYSDPSKDVQSDPIIRGVSLKLRTRYPELEEAGRIVLEHVDGEDWFLKVSRIDDGNGLDLWCVVAVDYEYMLGEVDRRHRELVVQVEASNKKVQDDLESDRETMYIIIAVVTVFLIVFSVIFTLAITSPLLVLSKEMSAVATMKLEAVDESRPRSVLAEVSSMQKSFRRMVVNMREFRNYMPASLLQEENVEGEEEEEVYANEEKSAAAPSKGSRSHNSRSHTRGGRSTKHGVASTAASSQSAAMRAFMQKNTAEGLKKKGVSLGVINVCGWHTILPESKSDHAVYDVHKSFLTNAVSVVIASKGVVDVFMGDRVCASYNGVKACGGHRLNVTQGMTALLKAENKFMKVNVSAAASSGDMKVGNMGTDGLKKFTFLSPVVSFAYALERFGRIWSSSESGLIPGPPTNVLMCDKRVSDAISGSYFIRSMGQVEFPKRSPKPIDVNEVLGTKDVSEDEWMYQLEEGKKGDPNAAFNDAVYAAVNGDMPTAATKIEEVTEKDMQNIIVRRVATAVRAQVATQTPMMPTLMAFH